MVELLIHTLNIKFYIMLNFSGPLAYRDSQDVHTLIGIVSFGPRNCTSVIPDGFARVTRAIDWIRSYVRDGDRICPPEL